MVLNMSVDERSDLTSPWLLWTASTCRIVALAARTQLGLSSRFPEGFGIVDVANKKDSKRKYVSIPMKLIRKRSGDQASKPRPPG